MGVWGEGSVAVYRRIWEKAAFPPMPALNDSAWQVGGGRQQGLQGSGAAPYSLAGKDPKGRWGAPLVGNPVGQAKTKISDSYFRKGIRSEDLTCGYCLGLKAPNFVAPLNLKNKK